MEHILACPKCGVANRLGEQFCRFCGQSLANRCINCHAEVDPAMRGCPYCGEVVTTWSLGHSQTEEPFTNPDSVLELI
jgi:RNA polymerase subunit RPABC4/transcription elongation factor Spt4